MLEEERLRLQKTKQNHTASEVELEGQFVVRSYFQDSVSLQLVISFAHTANGHLQNFKTIACQLLRQLGPTVLSPPLLHYLRRDPHLLSLSLQGRSQQTPGEGEKGKALTEDLLPPMNTSLFFWAPVDISAFFFLFNEKLLRVLGYKSRTTSVLKATFCFQLAELLWST